MGFVEARKAHAAACIKVEKLAAKHKELKEKKATIAEIAKAQADLDAARLDCQVKEKESEKKFKTLNGSK